MNAAAWRVIKSLFAEARELPPARRAELLRRRAEEQPGIVAEVRKLLRASGDAEGFLDPPDPGALESPLRRLSNDFRGTRLGEFELVREIGRGTSGVVYLGRQPSLGREVAIKILAPQFSISEERRARFRREALAASKVHHPNVVSVLSFGEEAGICYLVLEHVAGQSLHALVQELRGAAAHDGATASFEPREAAHIVAAVARGLAACHRAGVIHRDVKPHNILLDERGEPRLVDFGLAKDEALASLSEPGSLSGTPHYMSPEQARAQSGVDHRSDVYSAGAVLYELLTLRPPADGAGAAEILRQVAEGRPAHLRLVAPSVPRALAAICMRALSKDPARRYPTADALADDLERFGAGRAVVPSFAWSIRDRLETLGREHPWILVAGTALLLLGIQPMAGTHVEAQRAETPGAPRAKSSIASQRIEELMELLPNEPIYHDDEGEDD